MAACSASCCLRPPDAFSRAKQGPAGTRLTPSVTLRRPVLRAAKKGGGGVLDRPATETAPAPGRESEFDMGTVKKKKRPPIYRVLLHNDEVNRREYVVQVLMKVVEGMTVDLAVNIMNEAHVKGMALVVSCAQEEAETYCELLRSNGLIASIEPDSTRS